MSVLVRGFVMALNHVLAQSPWACERLAVFAGAQVRLRAAPLELDFTIDGHGRLVDAAQPLREPDVTISVPLAELPTALPGGVTALLNAVHIDGNAELADALGFVFRNLRWDVEEDLSRFVGDMVAHRLVGTARALQDAHQRALQSLAGNLSEYLVEEQPLLVTHDTADRFEQTLRELRDGVARLEKRIDRLHERTAARDRASSRRHGRPG